MFHLIEIWFYLTGLEEYCNTRCGIYSGGNKRKLSTALAFIGDPQIVLLDEPSSGVDPMIRRKLWDVINGSTNIIQTVIISSHRYDDNKKSSLHNFFFSIRILWMTLLHPFISLMLF